VKNNVVFYKNGQILNFDNMDLRDWLFIMFLHNHSW